MSGYNDYIYVSYRKKQGFDKTISTNNLEGAMLHITGESVGETELVDARPGGHVPIYSSLAPYDAAMTDGQVIKDLNPLSGVVIKQMAHGGNQVVIQVSTTGTATTPPAGLPVGSCIPGVEGCAERTAGTIACETNYSTIKRQTQCGNQQSIIYDCVSCIPN